jgi:FkbM family methyltransferase
MNIVIRKVLRKANSIRKKYSGGYLLHNRIKLLKHFDIQTILDVGANTGQFAYYTRKIGYKNDIISFEPLTSAFGILEKFAKSDSNWYVNNYAIGNLDGTIDINISLNSQSSSILEMMPDHVKSAPDSAYEGKEVVNIHKLDSIINNFTDDFERTFLKIDTQGFEKNVIDGAEKSLKSIKGLQLELSMVELYKGETLIKDMINLIEDIGFTIYSLEPGFYDKNTGQLLQVDGIFFRK